MEHITTSICNRRSIRTFNGRKISQAETDALKAFTQTVANPYAIPVEYKFLSAKTHGLSCPVVSGTDLYVAGKIKRVPHANEAFGYSFERLVLFAQSLGIGTIWLCGTMNRPAFEKAMELNSDEMMPCASPLGYPSEKVIC